MKKIILNASVIVMALCCSHSQAFKIDTHLWIGQQVLNDLDDDGKITVKINGKPVTLPVSTEVKTAIQNNRQSFLLGQLGPDSFPDVVVGQTMVHPGVSGGWKTNDWMSFLLNKSQGNPLGTAFTYGYFGHAAADVFAHTYVNQYSGDIFELGDKPGELPDKTLVEQRHVALESFIGLRNPPLLNATGQSLGPVSQLVKPDPELSKFLRDTLIFDPEASAQYSKTPYGKHLAAYIAYKNAIESAMNSSVWINIDKAILQMVANYNGLTISNNQAGEVVVFLNDTLIPAVQRRQDLDQNIVNRINDYAIRLDDQRFAAIKSTLRQISSIQGQIAVKLAQRQGSVARILACPPKPPDCKLPKWLRPGHCAVMDRICEDITRVTQEAERVVAQIDNEINGTNGLRDQLLAQATRVRDQAIETQKSGLALAQALFDFKQQLQSNTSPAKAYLQTWKNNLDEVIQAYIMAANQSMLNTIKPKPGDLGSLGPFTPMSTWFDCYHLALKGTSVSCSFYSSFNKNLADLQKLQTVFSDATSLGTYAGPALGLPTPEDIRNAVESLKDQVIGQLRKAAINSVMDLLPPEINDIIDVFKTPIQEAELNGYYTKAPIPAGKPLLMIGDIADRVKSEMNLNPASNTYNPEKYAVVYNAVTLAKLALLDNAGLAQLAQLAGVPNNAAGAPLFTGTNNIVADAFASIDGNHQWMPIAPPKPFPPYAKVNLPGYPYPHGYSSQAGFVPWQATARDPLFRGLFIGPLSPGMDAKLRELNYAYQSCIARPFPDNDQDQSCVAVRVLPSIIMDLID